MNKLYEEEDIREIANSIRAKNGSSDTYKLSEMASAIDAIQPESYWENPTTVLIFHSTNNVSSATFTGTGTIPADKKKALLVAFGATEQTTSVSCTAVSNCTVGSVTQQCTDVNAYGGDKNVRNTLWTYPITITDITQEAQISVSVTGNENRYGFAMLIY